ncbi:MAG: hypothetical protein ACXU9U_05775, partial [Parachlamydiaceae bacterium]
KGAAKFLSQTDCSCVHLNRPPQYLRVIAEGKNKVEDVVRLMTFAAPAEESVMGTAQPKLRRSHYSSDITPEIWKEVFPYLIVEEHPAKYFLDQLFAESRFIESVESLEKAGFEIIFRQLNQGIYVVKHRKLPNYLLKLYLDSSPRTEWPLWVLRAKGARTIQKLIDKYFYSHCMKVPEKWIYPISKEKRPLSDDKTYPKDFLLVVTDMRLASPQSNLIRYKESMTYARLRALYTMITEGGLSDSHTDNIPFSKDGKMAFIDTEYVNTWPVHLDWLTKYFSQVNTQYWNALIAQGKKY